MVVFVYPITDELQRLLVVPGRRSRMSPEALLVGPADDIEEKLLLVLEELKGKPAIPLPD